MLSIANFLNNGMDQYFVFQNAFNKTHIQVLDLYVYNLGITGRSISLATAISMMKSNCERYSSGVCQFCVTKGQGRIHNLGGCI